VDKTLIIWLIGGNCTGKTTQAREIHKYFQKLQTHSTKERVIEESNFCYTSMSDISCNAGNLLKSQCSGTDTLSTKQQIEDCINYTKDRYPIVVIEGIMATGQWIHFLKQQDTILFTVFLNMTPEINFKMVSQRRAAKKGIAPTDIQISQKTKENMASKLRGFFLLYNRMQPLSDFAMKIDVDGKSIKKIFGVIERQLQTILLSV